MPKYNFGTEDDGEIDAVKFGSGDLDKEVVSIKYTFGEGVAAPIINTVPTVAPVEKSSGPTFSFGAAATVSAPAPTAASTLTSVPEPVVAAPKAVGAGEV